MRLKKCLPLLLFIISSNIAYSNFSVNQVSAAEDVPFNLSYNSDDFKFGQDVLNVFTNLNKGNLEKDDVDRLSKSFSHSSSFDEMSTSIDRLKDIVKIDSQDSFFQSCAIKIKDPNEYTNSLEERFEIATDGYCRSLFLKRMTKFSPTMNFSSRDLAYFKESVPFYLTGENQKELVPFLKHFKQNAPEFEKISNLIIDRFIETKVKPPSSVLTNIKISSKFHQFLQSRVNLDDNSISYFQEEFQKSIRDVQDALESNDTALAIRLANGVSQFYGHNKTFISDKRAFMGFVIIAKAFYFKGKEKEASDYFEFAKSVASKDELNEAQFYLIWPSIIEKDFKGLKKSIEKYNLAKDFDKHDAKLQFYIAYSEAKSGDTKKAIDLFHKIVSNSPYSFYSIIALKEIAFLSKGKQTEEQVLAKLINKSEPQEFSTTQFGKPLLASLKRYSIWTKLGMERFQTLELRKIQSLEKNEVFCDEKLIKETSTQTYKEFITLNLIKLLNSKKKFIPSFKIFQDSVDQNSLTLNIKILKQIFPLSYLDIIKKNAFNLDPLIVISLIRQESAFNPEAMSGVGAKGLMQLMPTTAKRFNKQVRPKHLSNPEINVAIGTKYLRELVNRFDGNLIYTLASYNAGENRIDRWRRELFKSDDPLATIETIPYEETRNYVKLIYRNYFFYNLIQNKSILKTPLEETFKISVNK